MACLSLGAGVIGGAVLMLRTAAEGTTTSHPLLGAGVATLASGLASGTVCLALANITGYLGWSAGESDRSASE
jgi:hypothetical protein